MARLPEADLPVELNPFDAVTAAYPDALAKTVSALERGLSALIECDKELVPYFYKALRDRLAQSDKRCAYLDGRASDPNGPQALLPNLLAQIRERVRGAVDARVIVLPHLDLLASSSGTLTSEAREVTGLLYENPSILFVGFCDPAFALPEVIRNLFPYHDTVLGVNRERLGHLVTQREARKFGEGLDVYALYKHVSGVNAVRLRRLLTSIRGEDYPSDPGPAYAQLRQGTLVGGMTLPDVDLHGDIGGYTRVKDRLQREILDILAHKDAAGEGATIQRIEDLVPRGMIFWGPPGTGKTLFAKAMATSLGAAVIVVSGPELKSKWHGESEQNVRRVFLQARQCAPCVIVFDELDSIAAARGSSNGDGGVGHSMVNQLLTELDGFRSNEMVFVVGTTNFPESLDPALLRPGRFEFKLHIPYPDAEDRKAIASIYAKKFDLALSDAGLEQIVRRTGTPIDGGRFTGDHLQALSRALARRRIRNRLTGSTEPNDVDAALEDAVDRPALTAHEERVVATHEAGHAVVALHCKRLPPIDRISIRGDLGGALGYVSYSDSANRYVQTRGELLERIAVLFGGREAEDLLLDDLSMGSAHDLQQATGIARWLIEELALDAQALGVRQWDRSEMSDGQRATLEAQVEELLSQQRTVARALLEEHVDMVRSLTELLLVDKVVERKRITALTSTAPLEDPDEA